MLFLFDIKPQVLFYISVKRSKGELQFYFKSESIIMRHRNNYISFHKYSDKRQKIYLERFSKAIINARTLDMDRVFYFARKYNIQYAATTSNAIGEKKR